MKLKPEPGQPGVRTAVFDQLLDQLEGYGTREVIQGCMNIIAMAIVSECKFRHAPLSEALEMAEVAGQGVERSVTLNWDGAIKGALRS